MRARARHVHERMPRRGNGSVAYATVRARASQGYGAEPNRCGDRVQMLTPAKNMPCTLFKASQKCVLVIQLLNHLFHSRDGMLSYQNKP